MFYILIGLGLSACNNSDVLPPEYIGGSDTYIELKLSAKTTSRTQTPETDGTQEESCISSAQVFLVRKFTNEIITVPYTEFIYMPEQEIYEGKATLPTTVKDGEYYIYVIANPQGMSFRTDTYNDFIGTYKANTPEQLWKSNNFLMSNTVNNINNQDNGGVLAEIKRGETNTVVINVERLAVKVEASVDKDLNTEGIKATTFQDDPEVKIVNVTITGATLANCVNHFNLIQQWETSLPSNEATGEAWLVTPSTNKNYPMEGGYYKKSGNMDKNNDFINLNTPMYCLENNSPYYNDLVEEDKQQEVITKMKGRTTAIVFRVKVELSKENNTFFRYKGKVYADWDKLIADFNELEEYSDNKVEAREKGLEFFEDGYMYYTYWIKDNGYTNKSKNYYAVMRNTWYKANVIGLANLGKDTPKEKEEDPIDEDKCPLTLTLKIRPWEYKYIDHILK